MLMKTNVNELVAKPENRMNITIMITGVTKSDLGFEAHETETRLDFFYLLNPMDQKYSNSWAFQYAAR